MVNGYMIAENRFIISIIALFNKTQEYYIMERVANFKRKQKHIIWQQ